MTQAGEQLEQFANLDLRTNKSYLHDFFAMRYSTFDDMAYFISRVRMEGNFNKSEINSDDIAFFAPELKDWKKQIDVCLYGAINCCHAVAPLMIGQNSGRIINLVGDSSRIGEANLALAADRKYTVAPPDHANALDVFPADKRR